MERSKRWLFVVLVVISVFMLILSLAGIVGTWIVSTQLSSGLVSIATQAENRVTRVNQGLDRLDEALTQTRDQIALVESDLQALGDDVEQNKPLLSSISSRLDVDLGSVFDNIRGIMGTIQESVAALNSGIEAINAIPFVSLPSPELSRIEKLSQDLEDLNTGVQELQATIEQRRTEVIRETVSILTEPTSRIITTIDRIQVGITTISDLLGDIQARLIDFKSTITRLLTGVAVFLTLILSWAVFSQVALVVLGWRYLSGDDTRSQEAKLPRPGAESSDPEDEPGVKT